MHPSAVLELEAFLSRERPGFESERALVEKARSLSIAYTEGATPPADAAASLAYLAHFGPRAIAAVAHAARACAHIPRHVLDVGAGSGASALAWFSLGVREVTLLERDGAALDVARRLLSHYGTRAHYVRGDVASAREVDADTVSSAFSFGEIPLPPSDAFAALARLSPRALTHVFVDAGDHARARRLQTLRDALVAQGRTIAGPCAHTDPCPALVRERDWCHDRIDKHLTARLKTFSTQVGRDADRMSLAWLVVGERTRANAIVVIGEPVKEKGRARVPVCGPGGVRFLQALRRHRAAHEAVLELPRGAHLPLALVHTSEHTDTIHIENPDALATP